MTGYVIRMPRANRYSLGAQVCHITHRCHDRAFLLKFARDRDTYRTKLREALCAHEVRLLSYAITSNHVHLLTFSEQPAALAALMQKAAGETAQAYNRRRRRSGAFWSDRYHATLVQTGAHLRACLCYIDLNMVRAGAASHPADWEWTGWHELMGQRQRYRLLDLPQLLECLGENSPEAFRSWYAATLADTIRAGNLQRQPVWTEAVAVGDETFVRQVDETLRVQGLRQETAVEETAGGQWVLRETAPAYKAFPGGENGL